MHWGLYLWMTWNLDPGALDRGSWRLWRYLYSLESRAAAGMWVCRDYKTSCTMRCSSPAPCGAPDLRPGTEWCYKWLCVCVLGWGVVERAGGLSSVVSN